MVPVALAYAGLAGMPPEIGLVTALVSLLAYAVLGTSRHLKVTTSSTMAIMSASVVTGLAGGDPATFVALSAALAITVGLMLLAAGLLRLGFLADFLAKPVVTGFVIGLAITIIVGQLPKLFGVPSVSGSVYDQLVGLVAELPDMSTITLAIGVGAILVIVIARRFIPIIPAPLLALVLGIVVSTIFDLSAKGVAEVGPIQTGMPLPSIPRFSIGDIPFLLTGAAGIVFLALGESLGAARSFATRHGYEIDGDQELIALGGANISAGLFGGFTVDASMSQSATAEAAGVRSQASSLATSALLFATVLFLAPIFQDLPYAVLGAVVIMGSVPLLDPADMRRYWRWRRWDFALALTALIGIVTTDVLTGLAIAVLLSLTMVAYRASHADLAVLGRFPDSAGTFGDVQRHPHAQQIPGLLIIRLDVPLYFFNANEVRSTILDLLAAEPEPRVVLVDMGSSGDLDVTTLDVLQEMATELGERHIRLRLAQVKGIARDRLRKTGLMDEIGEENVYQSVAAAVDTFEKGPKEGA